MSLTSGAFSIMVKIKDSGIMPPSWPFHLLDTGKSLKLWSLSLQNSLSPIKIIVTPGVDGRIEYYTYKLLSQCCPKVSTQNKPTITMSRSTPFPISFSV